MLWNDKHVVQQVGDYRIVVDDIDNPTYVTAWTPDNVKVGSLSTRHHPGQKNYLGVSTVDVDPKHRNRGLGLAMYRALMSGLNKRYKGISSYLPASNRLQT